MKEYSPKTILIPIDFSTTSYLALDHASIIAQKFDAKLVLVHVIERNFIAHNVFFPEFKADNGQQLRNLAEDKLVEISKELEQKTGNKVSFNVTAGKVGKEVIRLGAEHKADLIVMGTHGVSGFEEFFLGSNAARVVLESLIPVITVQDSAKNNDYDTILLPIDNSNGSREKVAETTSFAAKFNAKVVILGLIAENAKEKEPELRKKIEQTEKHFTSLNIPYQTIYKTSLYFSDEILSTAEEVDADLITIMTDQELDNLNFIMGPSAQKIVNHSKRPVLSITSEIIIARKFKNNPV